MKKVLAVVLACLMLVGLLAGCGGGSQGDENTIVMFLYGQEKEQEVYKDLIAQYEEESGIHVDLQITTADEYNQNIMAAQTGGTMPDVFYLGPDAVARYVANDLVLPLDDYLDQAVIDDLWGAINGAYRFDGKNPGSGQGSIYALPHDFSTFALAYNKDIFDEAGLDYPDPENPYTWDEFLEVCKTLTKDTDGDGEIDQWGCANALQWALDAFIYTNNATFLNEDRTQVVIDSPEFVEALQYFADLTCTYQVTPSVEQDTALGGYQRWLDGQIGFYACGTWDVAAFMDKNTFPYDWGLCGWPTGASGVSMTRNGTVGFAVSKTTKNPQACVDLITLFSTALDGQKKLCGEVDGNSLMVPNILSYAYGGFTDAVNNGTIPYGDNPEVIFHYLEGNAKYKGIMVETTYTYTANWWTEFLNGGYQDLLSGAMTAEEYCAKVKPAMQKALDEANEQQAADLGD